jgi:hypothetical protein
LWPAVTGRAEFVSRCRKGGIHREFPGTHYCPYLGEIRNGKSANDKKAWKLLNDGRFKKWLRLTCRVVAREGAQGHFA